MERIDPPTPRPDAPWRIVCFVSLSFIGALLLFWVQPLLSKVILPWFGGAPAVWTTCMLVFQTLLLVGYAYAHWLSQIESRLLKIALHMTLIVISILLLPILPSDTWKPDPSDDPTLQIICTLLASIGAPFIVLASTSPLNQHLFASQFPGRSPYRLYALSNVGSLLALISYPFVVEPMMGLVGQSRVWSWLYVGFATLYASTACVSWGGSPAGTLQKSALESRDRQDARRPTLGEMFYWFALAATPSAMLLATTNQVCLDVASAPFLWVAPLSLYLLTFILCFDSNRWRQRTVYTWLFLALSAASAAVLAEGERVAAPTQVGVFFATLFVGAMFCHGELAFRRPHPKYLTLFYLMISAAGAAGGIFVAVVAPRVFNSYFELPITIVATLALACIGAWPTTPPQQRRGASPPGKMAATGLLIASCCVVVGLASAAFNDRTSSLLKERSFFGVLRVAEEHPELPQATRRSLIHGRITHGAQYLAPNRRGQPTTYYTPRSGVGIALAQHKPDRPRVVGVVGLGAGTLATYGRAGDLFRFYEIDPAVERLARQYFTYLKDSPAAIEVLLGDARMVMERQAESQTDRKFDLLVIDAFSSDAIPTHLITREAMELFLGRMEPDGILAMHVTNQHLDLVRVVAEHALHFSLESRFVVDPGAGVGATPSDWALFSRSAETFRGEAYAGLPPLETSSPVVWTDRHCSLFGVLKPFDWNQLATGGRDACTERVGSGIALMEAGLLREAEVRLRKAASLNPKRFEPWLHLGNTQRMLGEIPSAIQSFEQAIRLNPTSSEAANNLGSMLTRSDPQRAFGLIQSALTYDPRNASAHNNLGNLLARNGDLKQAIVHYEKALAIDPTLEAARKNLVVLRSALDKAEAAQQQPRT